MFPEYTVLACLRTKSKYHTAKQNSNEYKYQEK